MTPPYRFLKALPPLKVTPGPVQRWTLQSTVPLQRVHRRELLTVDGEWYRIVTIVSSSEVDVQHLPSVS